MFPILTGIGNCFKASGSILFSSSTIFLNKNRRYKTFSPCIGCVECAVMDSLKRSVSTNKQLLQKSVFSLLSDDDTTTWEGFCIRFTVLYLVYGLKDYTQHKYVIWLVFCTHYFIYAHMLCLYCYDIAHQEYHFMCGEKGHLASFEVFSSIWW